VRLEYFGTRFASVLLSCSIKGEMGNERRSRVISHEIIVLVANIQWKIDSEASEILSDI
jgi:hypothetical protein